MTYQPGLKPETSALLEARNWAVGIVASIFAMGMFISELNRIKETLSNPLTIGYLILFVTCVLLIFIWIWCTGKELDICFSWLDPERYQPPSSFKEIAMIVIESLILILLFFTSRNPLWFGIIFSIYGFTILFTDRYARKEIHKAILQSRKHLEKENEMEKDVQMHYLRGIDIISHYFDTRPHFQRHLITFLLGILGLSLGIIWKITNTALYGEIAYIIFILSIWIPESILAFWRIERDNGLREIKEEINEISRMKGSMGNPSLISKRKSKK